MSRAIAFPLSLLVDIAPRQHLCLSIDATDLAAGMYQLGDRHELQPQLAGGRN